MVMNGRLLIIGLGIHIHTYFNGSRLPAVRKNGQSSAIYLFAYSITLVIILNNRYRQMQILPFTPSTSEPQLRWYELIPVSPFCGVIYTVFNNSLKASYLLGQLTFIENPTWFKHLSIIGNSLVVEQCAWV